MQSELLTEIKARGMRSKGSAPFESLEQGDLVGVFEISAHRYAVGDTRNLYSRRLYELCDVHGRSLSLDIRIRGEDYLLYILLSS